MYMIVGDGSSPDGAGDESKDRKSSDKCNSVAATEKVDETKAEDSRTGDGKVKGLESDTKEVVAPELSKDITSSTKEKTSVEAT